ncbi:hypothetical protein XAC3810_340084 [Xanthomonas citri pv. citri]|nr:hypothetical protein XAC3824_410007 [Xanthomonas citri pv. citri]CEE27409.1 hypothetical protein XAC1083_370038 [Xanthomonas citri pv. citri]CEE29536.1 hypothetical protein XAC902_1970001 [Xanthomonas citri pv. citri]CEE36690.1 hypothetical protein XAC3810_340084 [Xanthomonas citri pv. citri]CEE39201.1 hypothetical protein XAC2911_360017 [Xanthomonas citri pv. citri]
MLHAGIAQLVERNLAKVEVASSSLVSRSKFKVPFNASSKKDLRVLFCLLVAGARTDGVAVARFADQRARHACRSNCAECIREGDIRADASWRDDDAVQRQAACSVLVLGSCRRAQSPS